MLACRLPRMALLLLRHRQVLLLQLLRFPEVETETEADFWLGDDCGGGSGRIVGSATHHSVVILVSSGCLMIAVVWCGLDATEFEPRDALGGSWLFLLFLWCPVDGARHGAEVHFRNACRLHLLTWLLINLSFDIGQV